MASGGFLRASSGGLISIWSITSHVSAVLRLDAPAQRAREAYTRVS